MEYLKNIDPASIDEDLKDIGVTPANIEAVVEGLELIWGHASSYKQFYDRLAEITSKNYGGLAEVIQEDSRPS